MIRRRSRFVLIMAAVMVVMLYRVVLNSQWDPKTPYDYSASTQKPSVAADEPASFDSHHSHAESDYTGSSSHQENAPAQLPELKSDDHPADFGIPTKPDPAAQDVAQQDAPSTPKPISLEEVDAIDPVAQDIHAVNPPARVSGRPPVVSQVHWQKLPEHFPVPEESIIPLPTGTPKKFPAIQYKFSSETAADKEKREKRQALVKAEAERAWGGYRNYAWMHDELTPLSKESRDPFCGWAATLVDSLDTLWIMGMKDEFDEAARAVRDIDFTYSPKRRDIPVFETTIRYLGGLLAAYDVSGGRKGNYPMLLEKAIELAEILMGAFDTPNRMPILYYNWMPDYASQPHRAGTASIAELASLSMEFTRLAQLTKESKYYDAVARITNGLKDLQDRKVVSTFGLFPENLDVSGCNRTATAELARQKLLSDQAQQQVDAEIDIHNPTGYTPPADVDASSIRADPEQGDGSTEHQNEAGSLAKRSPPPPATQQPIGSKGKPSRWECVEQGIEPSGYGYQQYSMGGSQDSAYEYFPKQDLVLGGLEPVYKTLHLNTIEATKKHLLYRPMIPNDRNVLFPGKMSTVTGRAPSHTYEATHLACFLGGMFGLGGKMYEQPEDVELAKRLTDGCVWAYEATASGLMPEGSNLIPCQSWDSCPFNEELWWRYLDPSGDNRVKNMKAWEERQEKKRLENEALLQKQLEEKREAEAAAVAQEQGAPGIGKREPQVLDGKADVGVMTGQSLSADDSPSLPIPTIPQRNDPKPKTHEEYVKEKIAQEHIPPGFASINDRRYILRPEAIESVWYMYRITGDPIWQEKGWRMFEAVVKHTRTEVGASAVDGVLSESPYQVDNMESFWLAETLKYYYLLFSTPDVISLDEWVLNTEAHPFLRPT